MKETKNKKNNQTKLIESLYEKSKCSKWTKWYTQMWSSISETATISQSWGSHEKWETNTHQREKKKTHSHTHTNSICVYRSLWSTNRKWTQLVARSSLASIQSGLQMRATVYFQSGQFCYKYPHTHIAHMFQCMHWYIYVSWSWSSFLSFWRLRWRAIYL